MQERYYLRCFGTITTQVNGQGGFSVATCSVPLMLKTKTTALTCQKNEKGSLIVTVSSMTMTNYPFSTFVQVGISLLDRTYLNNWKLKQGNHVKYLYMIPQTERNHLYHVDCSYVIYTHSGTASSKLSNTSEQKLKPPNIMLKFRKLPSMRDKNN